MLGEKYRVTRLRPGPCLAYYVLDVVPRVLVDVGCDWNNFSREKEAIGMGDQT